jgi:small subunit ribosomal protein S20
MPIIPNAIRKLRADKRKTAINDRVRKAVRQAVSATRKKPTQKTLSAAFAKLDLAVKAKVIHKNKAARLKSRLAAKVKK